MKQPISRALAALAALMVITLSLIIVRAAGGQIEGKVSDPKGAAVVGATVRVTDNETNRTSSAVTDAQGRYKIAGLTAGSYTVVVSANGFTDGRLENVKVDDDAVAPADFKLEIATVQAQVDVTSGGKGNSEPLYQQLRQQAKTEQEFSGPYATV